MNAVGIALVWCVVQVTLAGILVGGVYLIWSRFQPAVGKSMALAGLLIAIALSAMVFSPWPRWSFRGWGNRTAVAVADAIPASPPADRRIAQAQAAQAQAVEPPMASVAAGQDEVTRGDSSPPLFLQRMADELTGAQSRPAASSWGWPAVVALGLAIAAGLGAAWLAAGLLAVRACLARSRRIEDAGLRERAEVLRVKLGCQRPIELRQSDSLASAAVIGWRRPVVLLPAEWTGWTEAERQAVLAHEIAHIRAGDFWAVVCGQLGVVLHFYHPLVHWLMHRLRLEQELAADRAAAGVMGGPQSYLTVIAGLALRAPERPLPWPARSVLPTRNTFLRRIVMLRDHKPRCERPSPALRVLAIAAVVLCGLLAAGLRGPSGVVQALSLDAEQPAVGVAEEPSAGVKQAGSSPAVTAGPEERLPWHPEGLVAVFGSERGRMWAGPYDRGFAVSPDGRQLASGASNGGIWLWDASTLKPQALLRGHREPIRSVQYTADGKTLVSVGEDKTIRTWDLSGGAPTLRATLTPPEIKKAPLFVAWSADRRVFVTRSVGDMETRLWRVNSGAIEEVGLLPRPPVDSLPPHSMTDQTAEVKKEMQGVAVRTARALGDRGAMALSPDGRLLAFSSGGREIRVQTEAGRDLWQHWGSHVTVWQIGASVPGERCVLRDVGYVLSLAFGPTGDTLAIGSHDKKVRLYSLRGDQPELRRVLTHDDEVRGLCFSPNGSVLVAASDRLRAWDLAAAEPVQVSSFRLLQPLTLDPFQIEFRPDGQGLFVVDDGMLRAWDLKPPAENGSAVRSGDTVGVDSFDFTPDGRQLLATNGRYGTVCIWDFATFGKAPQRVLDFPGLDVSHLVVAQDGKRFVFSSSAQLKYTLRLWELAGAGPRESDTADLDQGNWFWCCVLAPDGAALATGHSTGAIRLWDIRDGRLQLRCSVSPVDSGGVCSLDCTRDGKTLASADRSGNIILWSVDASKVAQRTKVAKREPRARQVRFSPDGQTLASGDENGTVMLWDIARDEPRARELKGHSAAVTSVSFAADGATLLSSGHDGKVLLWNVATAEVLRRWEFPGEVRKSAFDPSGRYIVSANGNGCIYVWRREVGGAALPKPGLLVFESPPAMEEDATSGDDPFAPPSQSGKQVSKSDEQLRKWDKLLHNTRAVMMRRRAGSPNDFAFLEDSFWLLQPPLPVTVNDAEVLRDLVERPWQRPVGEPWRPYLARLVQQAEQAGDETNRLFAKCLEQHAELAKAPRRSDWQARRAVWLDLVELMLATKSGEDRQTQWRAAADKHVRDAGLFRRAHIVSVRGSPKPRLDWEFVLPAFTEWSKPRSLDGRRWSIETLDVLLREGGDPQRPSRKEAAELLLRKLRDDGDRLLSWPREDLRALASLYRYADDQSQPEAQAILLATLNTQNGHAFNCFAAAIGMPPERRLAVILAERVCLPEEGTLEQSLRAVLTGSRLGFWIDDTTLASQTRLDTTGLEGPRLTVLEKLLASTKLRLEILDGKSFWIGPPDRLAAARQLHANSLQRAAGAQGKVAAALMDETRWEFIQTPLEEVIVFLRDMHEVGCELLDQPQKRITMNVRAIPLHLALTHLARLIDGDWCVADDTIFVGNRERLAPVQQLELTRLRRWSRLALLDNALTRALRSKTRLEFIESPLSDVAAFLGDQHKVPIRVGPAQRQLPITYNLKGISLEQALNILCRRYDLDWETDGQSILIGTKAEVKELRREVPDRARPTSGRVQ